MRKILASILAITMLLTTLSVSVIPVSANDVAVATDNIIYSDNFNDYATEENWIGKIDEDGYVTGVEKMPEKAWSIFGNGYKTDEELNSFIGVVNDPTASGTRGQVLRIDVNKMPNPSKDGVNFIGIQANANGGNAINRADMSKGKKLVLKADIYAPSTRSGGYESSLMRYVESYKRTDVNYGGATPGPNHNGGTSFQAITNGTGWGNYGFTRLSKGFTTWTTIKRIVDVSADTSAERPADTARFIYNNKVMTVKVGTEGISNAIPINEKFKYAQGTEIIDAWHTAFVGEPLTSTLPNFYGTWFANSQPKKAASTKTEYFIDNVEAYWIDAFKQEGEITYGTLDADGRWYKDAIAIPFNNEIAETVTTDGVTAKTWTLTDLLYLVNEDGEVVEGGIAKAERSADKKTLLVTPVNTLDADKKYTITADARFSDVELQGLSVTGEASETTELATFTMGVDPTAHIYFDEDFDDYSADVIGKNWFANFDSKTGYVTLDGIEENAWRVGGTGTLADGEVKVVADPTNSGRGNVLSVGTGTIAGGKTANVLRTPNATGSVAKSTLEGKRIVIEGEIYLPTELSLTEESMFVYYGQKSLATSRGASYHYIIPYQTLQGIEKNGYKPSLYFTGGGSWNYWTGCRFSQNIDDGEWHKYRYVIDVSDDVSATRVDTVRGYFDGKLMVAQTGEAKTNIGTEIDQYPLYEDAAKTQGRYIVDNWKRTGDIFNSSTAKDWKSAGDFYGIYMGAMQNDKTNQSYYVDNMTAYYIDDLALTTPDLSNYTGGTIRLPFNQEIAENFDTMGRLVKTNTSLKDMFKIVDKDGNDIDGVKSVKLSPDKKTVIIAPQNLADNTDYTVVISRYFRDKEGQGLTKNSTEYEIPMSVGTVVAFTLNNLSQNEISGFSQGRAAKVTAEFSMNIDDDMITNGIVVKNDAGEVIARNAGWTATINAENAKIVEFDFGNLPTDSYTVTTNENFAVSGEELSTEFLITITEVAQPIILFDEDFETGYAEGNWLVEANKTPAGVLNKNQGNYTVPAADGKGSWDIQLDGNPTEFTDFVGVVDAPETVANGMSGKVLKVSNERSVKYNALYTAFRRNFDKDYTPYRFDEGEYAGKVLVYEADVYSPAVRADTPFFQPSINKANLLRYNEGIWKATTNTSGQIALSGGSYQDNFKVYGHAASWFRTNSTNNFEKAPNKVRMVIDQSTELDTMRMYVGGVMHTYAPEKVAMLKGHAMNDMEGRYDFGPAIETTNMNNADQEWNMNTAKNQFKTSESIGDNKGTYGIYSIVSGAGTDANTESVMYFDNFKAYLVDSFDILNVEGESDVFNTTKASVTYTFSKKVDVSTAKENESIVLLDAEGNEVTGGIKSVTPADGDYQLIVKLNENLPAQTKYTIKVMSSLRDVDGLSLRTQYSYYLYDIDAHYNKVEGKDNVYLIERANSTDTIEGTYTPRVMDGNKVVSPAYLTYSYYNEDNGTTTVTARAATDMYVKDEAKMMTKVDIVTSEFQSLFAKATEAVINGNKVTTTVTITNPEVEEMDVWCVVAVFGEFNEMLGCTPVAVGNDKVPNGNTDAIPVEVEVENGSAVKSVKLFVWDSYDNMKPYHKASIVNYTNN